MSDPLPIKKVSIITVTHNNIHHTKRFVRSLHRFTPQAPIKWELIVIDNGSRDETLDWFHSTDSPEIPGEVVPLNENTGWPRAVNIGIQKCSTDSDVIIWANNDVVVDRKGWLERLCSHFTELVGAVGPTSNYVIGRQHIQFNHPHIAEEETNTLIGLFYAARKDVIDQVGGLDEELGPLVNGIRVGGADDHDISIRIRRAGFSLVIARDVFVHHAGSKTFMDVLGPEGYNNHWKECDQALEEKWGEGTLKELFAPPLNVALGIPLREWHPHWKFCSSLYFMVRPWNWTLIDCPRAVVDQARNAIVDAAKQRGCQYILFLDDDHVIPPDTFTKLWSHQKDVVGALAYRRLHPFSPCVFDFETNPETGKIGVRERPDLIGKGLQKVDAIGFAAVLIKTEIFEKLGPPPWFKFEDLGEDLHFCLMCYDKNIEVFCDTDLEVPHINADGQLITKETYFQANPAIAQALTAVAR